MKNIDLRKMIEEGLPELKKWQDYPYWKNVFGLSESQYFTDLFRIEAFDDFKRNIENNTLFFRHPNEWLKDDRLDSILLRLKIVLPDGTEVRQGYYDDTFCQCWSTEDSTKMWNEYTKDNTKSYIKMVSNVDAIMRAYDDTSEFKGYSSSFYAGVVNSSDFDESSLPIYLKTEQDIFLFFHSELIAQLFLEKRSKYDFENEVRFVFCHQKECRNKSHAFVPLKKSLAEMLKGIIIDPRLKCKEKKYGIIKFATDKGIKILKTNKKEDYESAG
jgi:hypothetical protein